MPQLDIPTYSSLEDKEKLQFKIEKCYEESIDKETLFFMLAINSCFILEFFRREINEKKLNIVFQLVSNSYYKIEKLPLFILIKPIRY
jgi:hypothetical protein